MVCHLIMVNMVNVAVFRCFCAVPFRGKMYVFGGESEKFNKKSKVRGKRELNRNAMW